MLHSAIQDRNADFRHKRCCSQIKAVEFVPHTTTIINIMGLLCGVMKSFLYVTHTLCILQKMDDDIWMLYGKRTGDRIVKTGSRTLSIQETSMPFLMYSCGFVISTEQKEWRKLRRLRNDIQQTMK